MLADLPAEEVENDPVLLKEVAGLLTHRFGLDADSYQQLVVGFANNQKLYQNIYKAFEEEIIERNPVASFKN